MAKSLAFGEKANQLRFIPTFEHELFFYFLLMSPSYQLAHELKNKKKKKNITLPKDFELVKKTYDLIGDIYKATFEDWWQNGGYKLFEYQTKIKKLAFSVDLSKPQSVTLKEIQETIKSAYDSNKNIKEKQKISFVKNKLHYSSLNDRKNFLINKAVANFKLGKEVEHWRVAVRARVLSKWIEGLTFDSKPTQENLKARIALGELSSKLLKEGWHLCENAARLNFPSCKPNSNALPFDFVMLKDVMFNYAALEVKMLEKYKDHPDLLIRDQYLLNIKRHFRKKRRVEKAVDKAVDEAVTKALKKEKEEQAKLAQRRSVSYRR
jgi:hypothetical protein